MKFHESQIVYEDNHLLVISKKPSQLVQGDKTGDVCLIDELKQYLKEKHNKLGNVYLGLVHRIDRPTSGLVIFAKTSKALTRLNEMIKKREIKKTYLAVVKQVEIPKQGELIHYLKKNQKNNRAIVFPNPTEEAKKAVLHYNVIKNLDTYMILEIDLETGRHHQIRAQLSKIGIPIKGDVKYGFQRANTDKSIHLNARKLEFIHPVTKETMILYSQLPDDILWNQIKNEPT
ncbi:MAG: RNA pseudouridine synthase [Flavobacteriales bacterium]|nr:RNA pseudouridine synthase [Flavobacteriales bacterium]